MKKMYLTFILFIISCLGLIAEEHYNFQPTNGPYGGYIRSFCYDSSTKEIFVNADHIYKLNRTTNKWERQFEVLDSNKYYFYTLTYTDSIYFMSYIAGETDVVWGSGLFRSTDKGTSWEEVNNFSPYIRSITTLNNYFFIAGWSRIYRSADYGLTWSECMNGIDSLKPFARDFDQIITLKSSGKDYIFVSDYDNGIYRSSDNGDSWQEISKDLPKTKPSNQSNYTAMTTTIDNKLYVSTTTGIYFSNDFGDTWTKIINGIQSFSYFDMNVIKSDNKGNVFAGSYGINILRLMQNDTTWEKINKNSIPLSTYDILFDDDSKSIYAATIEGIYKSTDNGDNWFFYNDGIKITVEVKSIAAAKNGNLFAGTEYNGINTSTDNGNSWKTANNGITDAEITKIKIDSKGNVYAGSAEGHIFKSSNNGASWLKLDFGNKTQYSSILDIAINSKDEIIPIMNNNDSIDKKTILFSKEGGNIWDKINFPHPYKYSAAFDKNDAIFIAADSTLLRSRNNGITWEEVLKLEQHDVVSSIFVSMNNTIFAGTRFNGIFKSTENGNTWVNLTQGLSEKSEISCIISPDMENRIICGTIYDGYYVSNDYGDTWTNYNRDLPFSGGMMAPIEFKDFSYDGNRTLYAATYSGVFKWDDVTDIRLNTDKSQLEISPNPATDHIEIQPSEGWQPSEGSNIQIFNTLGEIVLSVEQTSPSVQRIDISKLSPGIYFIKIGNRVEKFVKI